MDRAAKRIQSRKQRQFRVRKKIEGTAERPRLAVFRSSNHIYVQAIDDSSGVTLASASTQDKTIREGLKNTGNKSAAEAVGKAIAQRLKEKQIETAVFDRGGFLYHGRVQALAEAAREGGLNF